VRRRVVLIANPFATRVSDDSTEAVAALLRRVADVEVVPTQRPGHATELAEAACTAGGCDAIVVFSGDGGFNEAVNGSDGRVPLAFIPGGGTSVLPRALGLPRDPVAAAGRLVDALARDRVRRITVGRVNGRRFTFSAGIGIDAEAVRRMDALGRSADGRRPGDLRFALTLLRLLADRRGRFEPVLEVHDRGRAAFALVSNGDPYTYAGPVALHVAPAARFELGLDVAAPRRLAPASLPRAAAYVLSGRGAPPWLLRGHDLDRIEIHCDRPLPLQADGEDLGDVEHAVFEAEREALPVLV